MMLWPAAQTSCGNCVSCKVSLQLWANKYMRHPAGPSSCAAPRDACVGAARAHLAFPSRSSPIWSPINCLWPLHHLVGQPAVPAAVLQSSVGQAVAVPFVGGAGGLTSSCRAGGAWTAWVGGQPTRRALGCLTGSLVAVHQPQCIDRSVSTPPYWLRAWVWLGDPSAVGAEAEYVMPSYSTWCSRW